MTTNAIDSEGTDRSHHHTAIVLFYKYFDPSKYPLVAGQHASFYEERIRDFQQDLCSRLSLKGRVAVAREGINGTLSAPSASLLKSYVEAMEAFELIRDVGIPNEDEEEDDEATGLSCQPHFLFSDIDWKESSVQNAEQGILEPFPDLKIAIVKEIISSGSTVTARDVAAEGGRHLTAKEFHDAMLNNPDAVLIDVRNSFEHSIGHFVHPLSGVPAVNPDTKEFSTFDSTYCKREADNLKDKMVLLSCTGESVSRAGVNPPILGKRCPEEEKEDPLDSRNASRSATVCVPRLDLRLSRRHSLRKGLRHAPSAGRQGRVSAQGRDPPLFGRVRGRPRLGLSRPQLCLRSEGRDGAVRVQANWCSS
jgi:predicted sulfurtransferase